MKKAFGIIQIVMATAVIMTIAGAGTYYSVQIAKNAQTAVLKKNLETIRKCLQDYSYDMGCYPTKLSDLATPGAAGYQYLRRVPIDPFTKVADWDLLKGNYVSNTWVSSSQESLVTGEIIDVRSSLTAFSDL